MSQNDTLENEAGFHWDEEPVSAVFGENNQSDKRVVNAHAQILVIDDLEAFRKVYGDKFLLAMSDGTSTRVMCQRIGRKFTGRDIDGNRVAVLNAIAGVRARATAPVKHPLADGSFYTSLDETEYRQLYALSLVDNGVEASVAAAIAKRIPW